MECPYKVGTIVEDNSRGDGQFYLVTGTSRNGRCDTYRIEERKVEKDPDDITQVNPEEISLRGP